MGWGWRWTPTIEGAVPHLLDDGGGVGDGAAALQRLIDSVSVEQHSVVEGGRDEIHLRAQRGGNGGPHSPASLCATTPSSSVPRPVPTSPAAPAPAHVPNVPHPNVPHPNGVPSSIPRLHIPVSPAPCHVLSSHCSHLYPMSSMSSAPSHVLTSQYSHPYSMSSVSPDPSHIPHPNVPSSIPCPQRPKVHPMSLTPMSPSPSQALSVPHPNVPSSIPCPPIPMRPSPSQALSVPISTPCPLTPLMHPAPPRVPAPSRCPHSAPIRPSW